MRSPGQRFFDGQLHADLAALFARLKRETAARAVLLTGSKRAFSRRRRLRLVPDAAGASSRSSALRRDAKQIIWDLLDVELPIVAAVNGHAVGLGASIALLCDVVFMADTATIGDPHVRIGIVAGDGGAAIWPVAASARSLAKRYLLTGDPVTAEEADRMGLVTEVVPADDLRGPSARVRRAAGRRRAARRPGHEGRGQRAAQAGAARRASTSRWRSSSPLFQRADHEEALAALREKRPPRFEGR